MNSYKKNRLPNILIALFLIFAANALPQSERHTKSADNGYTLISLEDPIQPYSTSKENYLGSILERYRLTQEKYPEIESLGCKDDIESLQGESKSDEISLEDIVNEINRFYSNSDNMIIPIIFAYCYSIKKIAGTDNKALEDYRQRVLNFCDE